MSGKGDPFGSGGKTVIMPNPGGAPRRDPFEPLPPLSPQKAGPSPVFNPSPPPPPGHGMPQADPNDWVYERAPARPAPGQLPPGPVPEIKQTPTVDPARRIPLDVALRATEAVEFSAVNLITQAAAPLLILLGRLRLHIVDMQAVPLMAHVARSITEF